MARQARLAFVALALVSCGRPEPQREGNPSAAPSPLLPASTARPKPTAPEWMATLPAAKPTVVAGAEAWVTLLQAGGELAEVAVVRVDSVGDGVLSVIDKTGQRTDGVPAALAHPIGDKRNLREGTLALFYTWTTPSWIGRVSHAVNHDELRVRYDWAGTTRETPVDHAEPLRGGITPLAFVAFRMGGSTSMGQIVALDAARAWVLTGSGHVELRPRGELEALELHGKDLSVGQAVRAYRWGTGFERGTVAKVLEPGIRYEIAFGPNQPAVAHFVGALVAL